MLMIGNDPLLISLALPFSLLRGVSSEIGSPSAHKLCNVRDHDMMAILATYKEKESRARIMALYTSVRVETSNTKIS